MIGKLDPEERVMEDLQYFPWKEGGIMDSVQEVIKDLGWSVSDDISVEVGGSSTYEIDGLDTKWSPPQGTRKYNKDAFIIIKNKDRNPVTSSVPQLSDKELDDKYNYDTSGK